MACSSYEFMFILRASQLLVKLLGQERVRECLKSSIRKFYSWYEDLNQDYEVSLFQILHDILVSDIVIYSLSERYEAKLRKYRGIFKVKSRKKTRRYETTGLNNRSISSLLPQKTPPSSEPSLQCGVVSHTFSKLMHWPELHLNSSIWHVLFSATKTNRDYYFFL